jgi:hypothetical protein
MKKTIRVCDKHTDDIPAIGTYTVTNGTPRQDMSMDLCSICVLEITTFFTPVKRFAKANAKVEIKRMKDRDRHRAKRQYTVNPKRTADYWDEAESKVMAAIKTIKTNVHIKDVMAATKLTKSTVGNALRRLVTKEMVMATGGRGRYRRYHMPS